MIASHFDCNLRFAACLAFQQVALLSRLSWAIELNGCYVRLRAMKY